MGASPVKGGAKSAAARSKGWRAIPITLMFVVLCGFSFFLGGNFCHHQNSLLEKAKSLVVLPYQINDIPTATTTKTAATTSSSSSSASPSSAVAVIPECPMNFQDFTPCTNPKRWWKLNRYRLSHMERHCPPIFERKQCRIPAPEGYKTPIKWPKSRNECWYRNVPYNWINSKKSNQHWLKKEGEKFIFPGGGTMFPDGVGAYVDLMVKMIPGMKDGTVRTAIDTGCGVASWGGDLLDRGILTMSLAPRDNHEAQVQFALERGIPALLGIISTQRLPFPSNSFDMAHCSRCLIPWTEFGGVYLLEIHRILRPGGFWVLSGPPVNYENRWRGWNTTVDAQKSNYDRLKTLLTNMCFKLYNKKDDIAVWQKSSDNNCYDQQLTSPDHYPPKCDDSTDADSAWYTPMRTCISIPNPSLKNLALGWIPKWPNRLLATPGRGLHTGGGFKTDSIKWKTIGKYYKTLLPALGTDKIRNVMDMNTVYGGLAAALIDDPVWVMNVVSSYTGDSLSAVFDRGLIGTYHDWCEAFSTYPRTYDLLHMNGLFTAESHRCEKKYVMLEMDRILRPNGYVIIREAEPFVDDASKIAKEMMWGCRKYDSQSKEEKEKVLVCQKKFSQ